MDKLVVPAIIAAGAIKTAYDFYNQTGQDNRTNPTVATVDTAATEAIRDATASRLYTEQQIANRLREGANPTKEEITALLDEAGDGLDDAKVAALVQKYAPEQPQAPEESDEQKAQRLFAAYENEELKALKPSDEQITALLSDDGSAIDAGKAATLLAQLKPAAPPVQPQEQPPAPVQSDAEKARGFLAEQTEEKAIIQLRDYAVADGEAEALLNADKDGLDLTKVLPLLYTKKKAAFAQGSPQQQALVEFDEKMLALINLHLGNKTWVSLDSPAAVKAKSEQLEAIIARVEEDTAKMKEGLFAQHVQPTAGKYKGAYKSGVVEKLLKGKDAVALETIVATSDLRPVAGPAPREEEKEPQQPPREAPNTSRTATPPVANANPNPDAKQPKPKAAPKRGGQVPNPKTPPKKGGAKPAAPNHDPQQTAAPKTSWEKVKSYTVIGDTDGIIKTIAKSILLVVMVALFPLTLFTRFIVCPLVDRCTTIETPAEAAKKKTTKAK